MEYKILDEVIECLIDYRGKTPKKSEKGIKMLSAKTVKMGFIDYQNAYTISEEEFKKFAVRGEIKKGDILVTTEAPLGCIAKLNRSDVGIAQRIIALRGKEKILDNDYLMYYLMSKEGQHELLSRETGTTVTGIKQSEIRKIKIPIYDIKTQKKIAKCLSLLDTKIDYNNQINNNLFDIANNLLINEFNTSVDFESLQNIIKFIKGKKPTEITNIKNDDNIKYLTISCLNNQENTYANPTKSILTKNDILMVMDGASSGDVYFSDYGIVGSTLAKVDVINNKFMKEYLFFALKYYADIIKSKNTGSAIPHADKSFINTLEIPIININEQTKYKTILQNIKNNIEENNNLISIRDTLLPKLIKGEINLGKIEI